jgi:hypothetical protein
MDDVAKHGPPMIPNVRTFGDSGAKFLLCSDELLSATFPCAVFAPD